MSAPKVGFYLTEEDRRELASLMFTLQTHEQGILDAGAERGTKTAIKKVIGKAKKWESRFSKPA